MNIELSKAIISRSRLGNKFLKFRTPESRDCCVSLLWETKKTFYETLNPRLIADNKTFCKQVKTRFEAPFLFFWQKLNKLSIFKLFNLGILWYHFSGPKFNGNSKKKHTKYTILYQFRDMTFLLTQGVMFEK